MLRYLVNGQEGEFIEPADRGLQYGDGCFETIAVNRGQPLLWQRHLERLFESCERLRIRPDFDRDQLATEAGTILAGRDRAVLKIVVTRGVGGRGYYPDPDNKPTRILSAHPWPDYPDRYRHEGVRLTICDTRLACNPALAGIKHLNRLEQVMARAEWSDEYPEGLMRDLSGHVIEGTMSNVFIQESGKLVTPSLQYCGIKGTMRAEILQRLPSLGVTGHEETMTLERIGNANAVFVCNSVIGLWPVTSIGQFQFPVTKLVKDIQRAIADITLPG